MPRQNCQYSKTIIYKIVCNNLNITDCYVGHTTEFTKRKYQHKNACTNENNKAHNYNVYTFIRANGNWDNWSMLEIEKYPCIDGNEARSKERYWFEQLNATLNSEVPNQTDAEYQKLYRQVHQADIKEYKNTKCTCQCGGKYTNTSKAKHLKTIKHQDYLNSLN